MKIEVLVEDAGKNWAASSDEESIQGCVVATGATREDAIAKFRSALKSHLDCLAEKGRSVPQITELEIRELVAA